MVTIFIQKETASIVKFTRIVLICLIALTGLIAPPKTSLAAEVDLKLVLAVDVSSSVDMVEARLQRNGYLQALVHPYVIDAITNGRKGRISVIYVEYAGKSFQRIIADWTIIEDLKSAQSFTRILSKAPLISFPSTSISAVIDFSVAKIMSNPLIARRSIIDISGDGPNSDGRAVWDARDDALSRGIIINGLPILSSRPDPNGFSPAVGVASHYGRFVIGGPGSFLISVNEYENFTPALVKKLIREIRDPSQILSWGTRLDKSYPRHEINPIGRYFSRANLPDSQLNTGIQ